MFILRSLLKNTIARSATEIINRLGAAVFWVLVARQLGAAALGALAFGLSLHAFFLTISTLGLGAVVIRDVARDRSKAPAYFGHTLILGFVCAVLAAGLMIGVTLLLQPNPESIFASVVMAVAVIPASGFYWSKSLLSAAEDMSKIAVARLGENSFKILVGIVALLWGAGIAEIAVIVAISKAMPAVIAYPYARRYAKPIWRLSRTTSRYLLRMIPSFSLISVFNSLFWAAPVVILTHVSGEYQAGLFSAAYKLVDVTVSFAHAYGGALFPIASRTLKSNVELFKSLFVKSIKYMLMMTLAMAAVLSVLSRQVILLVYGADMLNAAPVLQLLAWMIVPFSLVPVLAFSLVSHDLQRRDLLANLSATLVVVSTGILFSFLWGALGTALSIVLGCFAFFLVEYVSVQRHMFAFSVLPHIWKPALGVLLMSGVLYVFQDVPIFLNLALGGLSYLFYLMLSKAITKHELLMVKQLRSA